LNDLELTFELGAAGVGIAGVNVGAAGVQAEVQRQ
jgi:hypothetical protein